MIGNLATSLIRTVVPMIVGWLLALPIAPRVLSALGVDTQHATQVVAPAVGFVLAFAWYWAVRLLERRWPKLGVLLGAPTQPAYEPFLGSAGNVPSTSLTPSDPGQPAAGAPPTTGA